MKICAECKHSKWIKRFGYDGFYECHAVRRTVNKVDPVTGQNLIKPLDCNDMRRDEKACGADGKWFVQRKWWEIF